MPLSRWQTTVAPNATVSPSQHEDDAEEGPAFGFTQEELENAKPFSSIPTPRALPFFGNLFSFKPFTKVDPFDRVQSCGLLEERLGPIYRMSLPFVPQFSNWVEILDPNDFEIVFRNVGKYPERAADPAFSAYRLKRKQTLGLINSNHEEWWKLRQPLNKPMMRANAGEPYFDLQDPIGNELVASIRRNVRENDGKYPLLMDALQKWALESVCAVVFDRKLGCLDPALPEDSWQRKFIVSVTTALTDSLSLALNPIHEMYRKLGLESPTEKRFDASMDFVTATTVEMVEECRKRYEVNPEDMGNRFLPQLLSLDLSVDQKLVVIFDMMLAGIDTTTYMMTHVAYFLAKNPQVQDKLHQEIVTHCGAVSENPPVLTPIMISKLKYLKAVIKETHRMKPVIPLNVRSPARDIVIKGYRIPKGTNCFVENHYASVSEKHFANSLQFQPERWLRDGKDAGKDRGNPFLLLPFGFGARMCIGRRFAEQELYIGLIKLVQAFWLDYEGELPLKGLGVDKLPVKTNFIIRER